jgi:hypothetical protein
MDMGFARFIDKPVRSEVIYQCLAEELDVAFDYAEEVEIAAAPDDQTWRSIELPEALAEKLVFAVHSHSVTELERCLDEVESSGLQGQSLAMHLRDMAQRYDMKGIKAALVELGIGED